ncbi:MAG: flagellar biosynthetic protein FliR [Myxococcota bacterium]|jgi:flagellar biosynthetic protein FliR
MSWEFAIDPVVMTLLMSIRLLAMLQTAPMFREQGVPVRIRTLLALVLAYMIGPGGSDSLSGEALDWRAWGILEVAGVVFVEASIGIIIGLTTYFVFIGFWMMGDFISTQGGLSAARVVDPSSGVSSTALAQAFNGIGMLVFLALDGHHQLIHLVALSFNEMPIGTAEVDTGAYLAFAQSASVMFEIAVRLSAPITVAIFIQNIATGVLSKSLQQLNLMVVQLPAHIGLLLLILGMGAGDFVHAIKDVLETSPGRVMAVVLGAA